MPVRRPLLLSGALAAAVYTVVGLVYMRPIAAVYADHIAPNAGDPLFTLYVLKWVLHQAHLGFPDLWNANVFFPAKGALAFSDTFMVPAFAIAGIANPVAGYNLLFFATFVLTGVGIWWLLRCSGVSAGVALLGGAMYAFSPYRWSQENHLSILLAQWIPFTLWSFDRLLAERTWKRAALFVVFYSLNLSSGGYLGYMIHFPLAAILVSRWIAERREILRPAAFKVLLPAALLALAAAFATFYPYLRVGKNMSMVRDEREVAGNAAALTSYLSPSPENTYSLYSSRGLWERGKLPRWQQPFVRPEGSLFPGFLATGFAIVGWVGFRRRYRRPSGEDGAGLSWGWQRAVLGLLLFTASVAFILGDVFTLGLDRQSFLSPYLPWVSRGVWIALGATFLASLGLWLALRRAWAPEAGIEWGRVDPWERGLAWSGILCFLLSFPLVYIPLMQVVPGMNGMRVPARFASFVMVTVVFFAARGLDDFLGRIGPTGRIGRISKRAICLAGVALVLFAELLPRPLHWVRVLREEEFPPVYSWLADQNDVKALIEIPMRAYWREAGYMYYSTRHWKPIVNGYSSFLPPGYNAISDRVGRFLPDADAISALEALGVTHLVVHPDELSGEWRKIRDPMRLVRDWEMEMGPRVALVHEAEPDRVYRIVAGDPSPPVPLPSSHPGRPGEGSVPVEPR